jgi:sigma-B regulation protein RsbU (phosphoserine phosphatase)
MQTEMAFIAELSMVVAAHSELQPILDWVVHKTTDLLGADECTIKLLGADQQTAHTIIFDNRRTGPEAGSSWPAPVRTSVTGFLMIHGSELVTPDITADARFMGLKGVPSPIRALLAVPLRVDGRVTGLLAVSEQRPGRTWTASDVQLMSIVATHSAGVIEKARLRAEAEEKRRLELENERMEKELLLARDIQMRLVPDRPLLHGPWWVEGTVVPARQVGGDYYDYFPISATRFAVTIADVSGKGVPASLLVSTVQGTLRAFADGRMTPSEVAVQLNRSVCRSAGPGRFVTLFYAEVDHGEGVLRFVNAGHNFPILRRTGGEVEFLEIGGMPLGLFEDAQFAQGEVSFRDGDALLLYSDGITEAIDSFRQEFGEERLQALWAAEGASGPPAAFVARVLAEVSGFRAGAAQNDDMTAVAIVGAPRP